MSLSRGPEWDIILLLSNHLIFPKPDIGEEFDRLDSDSIWLYNTRADFEFELAKVFVRPTPLFGTELDRPRGLRAALRNLIVLLGTLSNVTSQFQATDSPLKHLFQPLISNNEGLGYQYRQLWSLLEHLKTSNSKVSLIKGHLGSAFNLPSDETLCDSLGIVRGLNQILDTIPPLSQCESQIKEVSPPPTLVDNQDALIRDYATATFHTVFENLNTCGTSHRLMLYLPSSKNQNPSNVFLDLLISVCPEHAQWQEAGCGICQ